MAYYIPKTVSGQTCTITDGAAGIPLESAIINIPASSPAIMVLSFNHIAPQYIFSHWVTPGEGGYGGSIDIIKGTGSTVLKHVKVKDLNWTYYTGGTNPIFYANNVPNTIIYDSGDTPNVALDGFTAYNASTRSNLSRYMPDNSISFISSGSSVAIRYTAATSKDQMIQALGDLDLVYESTETTNFTFTPIEVIMQPGENEFSSSHQNIITYYSKAESEDYYTIRDSTIKDIADAIRAKRESTSPILTEDMADEILNINAGTNDPFTKVWTSGQTGEETFTCSEEGKYLFLVGTSYRGTSSISSSVTPEYTFEKKGSNGEGLMGAIFNLSVGDTVTMTTTVSDWVASAKIIFRFNLTVSSVISDTLVRDTQLSSFAPTFTGSALFIYMAWGRTDNNSYDRTYSTNNFEWASKVNSQTYFRLSYGENTPSVNMYGYDGGGVVAICLQ